MLWAFFGQLSKFSENLLAVLRDAFSYLISFSVFHRASLSRLFYTVWIFLARVVWHLLHPFKIMVKIWTFILTVMNSTHCYRHPLATERAYSSPVNDGFGVIIGRCNQWRSSLFPCWSQSLTVQIGDCIYLIRCCHSVLWCHLHSDFFFIIGLLGFRSHRKTTSEAFICEFVSNCYVFVA